MISFHPLVYSFYPWPSFTLENCKFEGHHIFLKTEIVGNGFFFLSKETHLNFKAGLLNGTNTINRGYYSICVLLYFLYRTS